MSIAFKLYFNQHTNYLPVLPNPPFRLVTTGVSLGLIKYFWKIPCATRSPFLMVTADVPKL
jgi:hypothetical protein